MMPFSSLFVPLPLAHSFLFASHRAPSLPQMNAARRQREMAEYKKEVDRLVEEKRRLYEAALQQELDAHARAEALEAARLQVVEAERQRLLREHAAALADYLPKGVVQTPNDYELLFGAAPGPNHTIGIKRREHLQSFDRTFR